MLTDDGTYFAQHVGPASAFELIEWFLGPLPREQLDRDADREAAAARSAGLRITDLRTARCRMEFYDVGAVVWILRKCVWWVPQFTVDRYGTLWNGSIPTSVSARSSSPTPPEPSSRLDALPVEGRTLMPLAGQFAEPA